MSVVYCMLLLLLVVVEGGGADLYKKYWVARIKPHNYAVNPLFKPPSNTFEEGGGGGAGGGCT